MSTRRVLAALALSLGLVGLSACGTATGPTSTTVSDPSPATSADDAGDGDGTGDRTGDRTGDSGTPSPAAQDGDRATASGAGTALDFTSTTVAGDAFDGADLVGTPTVLWFWAPWCPTCQGQVDGVGALAETHGDAVDVVGVGSLDDPDAIDAFAEGVSPAVTMLDDAEGAVWRHFGVTAQSTYLVVDADGETVASGSLSDAELASTVEDLVG